MKSKFIGNSNSIVNAFSKLKTEKLSTEQKKTSWFNQNYNFIGTNCDETFYKIHQNYPIVYTERYIWHVSPKSNRESILKFGLLARTNGGVWANNSDSINLFYPWIIDGTDFVDYTEMDFWQIDTWKLNHKWRVDPYMHCTDGTPHSRRRYICTENKIPKHALTLFNFEYSFYTTNPYSNSTIYENWKTMLHINNLKRIY